MAPELRKRKSASDVAPKAEVAQPKVTKPATKSKRKATEDTETASPVAAKKQKPVKTVADAEPKKQPAKTKAAKAAPKKKAAVTKAKKQETVEEEDEANEEEGDNEENDENDAALVPATELDSEDDQVAEGASLFKEGEDVGKIPSISKNVQDSAAAGSKSGEKGVIYIGRVPHGFYEHEMKQYFSQFGSISQLRLSRNKHTGASKHFAFVEFNEESTAEVVAKTMDNYLLFGHILKCKVIPKEQVHQSLFKGANKRFKKIPWNRMAGKKLEKPKTEGAWEAKVQREKEKRAKNAEKLKSMGYEFEAPDLKDVPPPGEKEEPAVEEPKAIEAAPEEEEKEKETKAPKATKKAAKVNDKKATAPAAKAAATKKAKKAKA